VIFASHLKCLQLSEIGAAVSSSAHSDETFTLNPRPKPTAKERPARADGVTDGNGTGNFQPRQGIDYAISPKSTQFAWLAAINSGFFRVAIGLDAGPLRLTIAEKSQGIACLT
jgi:hypothetical protein